MLIKKKNVFAVIIYFSLSMIIYRVPLLSTDPNISVISGDLVTPGSLENFIKQFYPLWNDNLSSSNWVTVSRLFLYAPFLITIQFLNISPLQALNILWIFTETIAGMSMYLLSSYILQKTREKRNINLIETAAFVSGFLYMFNPYVLQLSHHITLKFVYALFPLYILTLLLSFTRKNNFALLFSALFLTLISSVFHYAIFGLILLLVYTLFFIYDKRKLEPVFTFLKTVVTYALFSAYWLIPTVLATINKTELSPTYILTTESVDLLSNNAGILNVFQLYTGWSLDAFFVNPPFPIFSPALLGTIRLLITVFALSILLSNNKNKYVKLFSLILVISIPISTGSRGFSDFYYWIVFSFPFGWVFRSPEKLIVFVLSSISILLAFSFVKTVTKLQIKRSRSRILFTSTLIILMCISGWPLLTGNFNSDIEPVIVPNEYTIANSYIQDFDDVKVLWMPKYWGRSASWNPNHATSIFDDLFSAQPTYYISGDPLKTYYLYTLGLYYGSHSLLSKNNTDNLGKYLAPLNIKNLLVHDDIPSLKGELITSITNLQAQDLIFTQNASFINIYTNPYPSQQLYIPNQKTLIVGGLESLTSFNTLNSFTPVEGSLIFLNQYLQNNQIQNVDFVDNIVYNTEAKDIVFFLLLNSSSMHIINPFENVLNQNPSKVWSRAKASDPQGGEWHVYIENRGLENWDFDYGEGLVFTWATGSLRENAAPDNSDISKLWIFNSTNELNQWKKNTKEQQFGALSTLTLTNETLKAELWNSTWGWKGLNSPLISADINSIYRFEFQIKGENVHKAHIKLIEYDDAGKILLSHHIANVGSRTWDWKTISFDFMPESPETKSIQLQIWHGHETEQPLPNSIYIDNFKVFDLHRFVEPNSVEMPFSVSQSDEYVVLARFFQNQQGGKMQVKINSLESIVNTKDQLNQFEWEEIDTLKLEKGQHQITMTNLEGFNAINVLAIIPRHEYQQAQKQLEQILIDKRIIQIIEAEYNLHYQNAVLSDKYGGEASNGNVLELTSSSRVWNELEIVKSGNYTIAIKGKGNLNIKINENEYVVHSSQFDWIYLGPVSLEKGRHILQITPSYRWDFEDGELREWQVNNPGIHTLQFDTHTFEGNYSLKAELSASTWGWKVIQSPIIHVTPGKTYNWEFFVAGENAHDVHVKIVEYDLDKNYLTSQRMKSIGSGNFTWKNTNFEYSASQNASYINLQIWHGHETTQPLPNKIWLDDVHVYESQLSDLDVVWLYSTEKEDETLIDVINSKETPAKILNYQKIDPTKYEVEVNATEPFMLAFAETYDPLWAAYVHGERLDSIPLYSIINGFWINQTGALTISIEYEPQKWFNYGILISITALLAGFTYIIYIYAKDNLLWEKIKTTLKYYRSLTARLNPRE
jgi:hypothetical protein